MSDKKKETEDAEMLKNLDMLLDMDIYEAQDDWQHLKKDSTKEHKDDKT
jgi:hypothetical protein